MTISHKPRYQAMQAIRTVLNLSTSKRTLMLLSNADGIMRDDWSFHRAAFGLSLVYFSLGN